MFIDDLLDILHELTPIYRQSREEGFGDDA
jgi:hypothetical protein